MPRIIEWDASVAGIGGNSRFEVPDDATEEEIEDEVWDRAKGLLETSWVEHATPTPEAHDEQE